LSPPQGSSHSRDVEANVNLNVNNKDNDKPAVASYHDKSSCTS